MGCPDCPVLHWGWDKNSAISQTTFSNAFSWMKSLKISLKLIPKVQINNIPELVQIIAWRPPGDKPLSGPMMVNFDPNLVFPDFQFELTNGYEMMHKAGSSMGEVPYCFSRSSSFFFYPNWASPDCNSSLNSPMVLKWCTMLNIE